MVAVPDAGTDPEAVVVEAQHTAVALVAVLRAQRLPHAAVRAPLAAAQRKKDVKRGVTDRKKN